MNNYIKLAISILVPLAIGFAGSFFTRSSLSDWYLDLKKPSFNPPGWIFAPVWTTLYVMIGLAFYLIWVKMPLTEFKLQFWVFAVQLLLNFLWSILFFGLKNPFAAFIGIIALWLSILYVIFLFYRLSETSAYLMIPYILWVTFAALLNFSIMKLNR